jgi:outer membrane protein TolC
VESVVRLREATLLLTEAERPPSLSVNSNYSRVAYPNGAFPTGDFRTNWTVGASVQVPILTGGRQRGSEAVARAELDQARLQLRQAQELAELDARSAHAELVAARAAFDASAGTVGQAVRAYEIAEVRFQSGVSTQLELSDARLLLQQAEANRAQAARDLQIARARVALLEDLPLGTVSSQSPAAITPASSSSSSPSQQQQQRQPGGGSGGMQ